MPGKYLITTLGCKVNQYESQVMRQILSSCGYEPVVGGQRPDVAVVNTCAVTATASRKSRQALRRLARTGARVIAVGCAASEDPGKLSAITGVEAVIGHEAELESELRRFLGVQAGQVAHEAATTSEDADSRNQDVRRVTGREAASEAADTRGNGAHIPGAQLPGEQTPGTQVAGAQGEHVQRDPSSGQRRQAADAARRRVEVLAENGLSPGGRQPESGSAPAGLRGIDIGTEGGEATETAATPVRYERWMMHHDPDSHGSCDSASRADRITQSSVDRAVEASKSDQILDRPRRVVKTVTPLDQQIERFDGHQRAFLKIQDGCDASCTYCIIPKLRPTLKSKPLADVVDEARRLVLAGYREIILTGIFLGAYGRPTALRRRFAPGRAPLAALVEALAGVEGLCRLRLSSLEPGDVDGDLLDVLASHANCVPHLHLPLQSGSDRILRRMNRQYGLADFRAMVDAVRERLDRPAISTDVIVGFPGETEEDFASTLETARHAGFVKIHAFPFSSRAGTAAARWGRDFVHPSVARERMNRLAALEASLSQAYRSRFVGQVQRVIVEGEPDDDLSADPWRQGRTDRYFGVEFEAPWSGPGDLVRVRIDEVTADTTRGTALRDGTCHDDRIPLSVLGRSSS